MFLHLSCAGPGGGGGGRERAGSAAGVPRSDASRVLGRGPRGAPGKRADARGESFAHLQVDVRALMQDLGERRVLLNQPPLPRAVFLHALAQGVLLLRGPLRGEIGGGSGNASAPRKPDEIEGDVVEFIHGGGSGAAGGTRPTRGRSRDARGRRTFVLGAPMTPPRGVDRGVRGRTAPRASESALGSSPPAPSRDWAFDETRRRRRCDSPRARIVIIWPRGGIRPLTLRFFSPRNGTASPASPPRGAPAHRTTPRRDTARPRAHRPVAAKRARGPLVPRAPDALLSRAF